MIWKPRRTRRRICVGSTLESWDKITLTHIETNDDSDVKDPVFAKTARLFDAGGMKGLLLNNLEVDSNFRLQYTSKDPIHVESVATPYSFTDQVSISNKRVLPQADVFKQKLWDIEPRASTLVESNVARQSLVSAQAPKSPTPSASCASTVVLLDDDEEEKKREKRHRMVVSENDNRLFDHQVTFEDLAARVTLKSDISYFDGDWTSKKIRFNWKSELNEVAEDEGEDGEVAEIADAQCCRNDCKDEGKDDDPVLSDQMVIVPEKLSILDENEPLENHRLNLVEIQRQMSIDCPPHMTDLITLADCTVQHGFLQSALRPAFFLEFTKDDAIITEKKHVDAEKSGPRLLEAEHFNYDDDSPTEDDFDSDVDIRTKDICPFYGSNDMFLISPSGFIEHGDESIVNDAAEEKQPEDEPWLQSKPVVDVAKVKMKLYNALVNEGADTFQGMMELCKDEKMKETSVAVCFVCTMHLANEQKLDLQQTQSKEDFGIVFNDKKVNSCVT